MYKLFKDGKELKVGDKTTNFRGEEVTIKGLLPPKKNSSCGHYYEDEYGPCYYVTTINAKFINIEND